MIVVVQLAACSVTGNSPYEYNRRADEIERRSKIILQRASQGTPQATAVLP